MKYYTFLILFTLCLFLTSCLWMKEENDMYDWLPGSQMHEGKTYGQSDKMFRALDTLTIPPNVTILGTRIEFTKRVTVLEGVNLQCNGSNLLIREKIISKGSETNPVTVNSNIYLSNEVQIGNEFQFTEIEGAILIGEDVPKKFISLTNCTIKNGGGTTFPDSTVVEVSNCVFENNSPYDLEMQNGNIEFIDSTNSFGSGIKINADIYSDIKLPVANYWGGFSIYGHLLVREGTKLNITSTFGLSIEKTGSIDIVGTSLSPVVISGGSVSIAILEPESISQNNNLKNVIFEKNTLSGTDDLYKQGGVKAGIIAMNANLNMDRCEVLDYENWAIQLNGDAVFNFTNCSGFDSTNIYYSDSIPAFD